MNDKRLAPTPTFNNSTLQVFAEMVQKEKLARKVYLNNLSAPKEEKDKAMKAMQTEERNVDTMLLSILNGHQNAPAPVYVNKRF